MELPDYARILWAYRRSILVVTLGAVAAAAAMTLLQPTTYEAHASGFVSYGTVINPSEAEASDSVARSRAKSYIDIAESRATAEAVIDRLKLQSTASDLINRIAVEQPVDTVLLKITAKASTPPAAQQLADAWVLEVAHRVTDVENPENLSNATTLQLVPIEAAELPSASGPRQRSRSASPSPWSESSLPVPHSHASLTAPCPWRSGTSSARSVSKGRRTPSAVCAPTCSSPTVAPRPASSW